MFDQDEDGLPGATYHGVLEKAAGGMQMSFYRVAQEVKLRFAKGYRSGARLFAQREFADTTQIFSCITDGKPKTIVECPIGIVGPCPAEYNPAELVPITAQLDCDAVIQQESTLFMAAKPPFPVACRAALR